MKIKLHRILLVLFLFQAIHTLDCPEGTYSDPMAGKCTYCQEGCLHCKWTWKEYCTTCRPGFQLVMDQCWPIMAQHCAAVVSDTNSRCTKCLIGYIWNSETGLCIPCKDTDCATCTSISPQSCQSCKPGFYLKSDRTCGACDDNGCLSCSGPGQNQCLACEQGLTLVGSACIPCDVANCATCDASQKCSGCNSGYYLDLQNNKCKYCGDGSASLIGATSVFQCHSCKSAVDLTCWLPTSLNSALTCRPGFGISLAKTLDRDWNRCVECPSNCKSCDTTDSSITDCTTCNPGYFLNEQKQCSPCQDNNCDQCSAEGLNKCTSCKPGFILQNNQCDAVCSDSNCVTCSGPGPNACTSCVPGHYLTNNGQCEDCQVSGCDICSSPGKCLSCSGGFYSSIYGDVSCRKCLDGKSSPPGSTSSIECYDCADEKCLRCSARNPGSCQACRNSYRLNSLTKTCDKCHDPQCLACTESSQDIIEQCTVCSRGYFPNGIACEPCADKGCTDCFGVGQGKCSACENGYFRTQENTCKACEEEGCISCSVAGTGKCSTCAADYYLKDNRCIPCGQGKSSPPGSQRSEYCITCDDRFCKSCHGERGITKCRACSFEHYLTKSNTCQHCDDKGCLVCSGPGVSKCTFCAANYQLSDRGTCEPCPESMLSKAGSFCETCGGGSCRVCNPENLDQCLNCLPGFYLKSTQCIACEEGKYPSDPKSGGTSPSYCRDCEVLHCKTCSGPGTGAGVCTSCRDGFALNGAGSCDPCQDKGCKACHWTGTRQCTACEADYYFKDNECVPCGEGKSSAAGSTKPEDCQSIQMNSSSSSSFVVVLGAVGVILAVSLVFLYKKTNIFSSKRVPSVSSSPANPYGQLQEVEESNSKHRIELGSLN